MSADEKDFDDFTIRDDGAIEVEDALVASEKATKKAQKEAKHKQDVETLELVELLKDEAFRKFVWRVLSKCGLYEQNISNDPIALARAMERRNLGVWLVTELLTANPNAYTQLQIEAVLRNTNPKKSAPRRR